MANRDGPVNFVFKNDGYVRTMSYLSALSEISLRDATDGLNAAAVMWQSEVKKHMPVEDGLARASVTVAPAEMHRVLIRASIGSNVPYVPYLEFGNEKGRGLMKAITLWKPGMNPILNWYAKDRDLLEVLRKRDKTKSDKARARYNKILSAQESTGSAEFAPPFRGSWQIIADRVVEMVRVRLAKALRSARR